MIRSNGRRKVVAIVLAGPLSLVAGALASLTDAGTAHAAGISKVQMQAATTNLISRLSPGARADLGGLYYDWSNGDRLVINFAHDSGQHGEEVKSKFRYPGNVEIGTAQYSMSALDAKVSQLTDYLRSHPNTQWSELYRDDVHDDVIVDTVGDANSLQQQIANDVGAEGVVVHHVNGSPQTASFLACDSTCGNPTRNLESPTQSSAPPVIGGLIISRPTNQVGWYTQCTSSFYATKGTAQYLMTAGHCDVYMNASTFQWSIGCCPGTFTLGTMQASRFQTGYQDDAGIINTTAGQKDEVWSDGGFNSWPTYGYVNDFWVSRVGQFLDGDDIPNAAVCDVGYHSSSEWGNYCGNLISNNATITYGACDGYPAVTLTNARIAGVQVDPGFSGGAVYANGDINSPPDAVHYTSPLGASESYYDSQYPIHALGIVSGKDGSGNLIYTHIQYAQSDLGVTVQTG